MIGEKVNAAPENNEGIEELRIRLRHLENDLALTRQECEDATAKHLAMLADMQRKNAELEVLRRDLEGRVEDRTSLLTSANIALEAEMQKQQRAELALLEMEDRTRLLLKHLPACLLIIETDGTARLASNDYSRRVLGLPENQPDAAEPPEFAGLDGAPLSVALITDEVLKHGRFDKACRLRRGRGDYIPVQMVIVPRKDASGKVTAYFGFAEDITERLRAEKAARRHAEEIAKAEKLIALGTLVAGVAHEINNPNNLIMLSIPMLKKWFNQLAGPAAEQGCSTHGGELERIRQDLPRLLNSVEQGSCRIRDIVRELREFALPDGVQPEHHFMLNEQVAAAASLLSASFQAKEVRLDVEYGRDLPPLKGHPVQIRRLVANLLKNALEALNRPADGWVRASTSFDPDRSEVVLKVADNGAGIAPECLPNLCDPFFTTRREQGSVGLGLAVADAIARAHGGRIMFDSTPGCGTLATARLPAACAKNMDVQNREISQGETGTQSA